MHTAAGGAEESDPGRRRAAFDEFFVTQHRDLARLAYLLTGDHDAADDVAAEALAAVWAQWERVAAATQPAAYARRIVVNLAADRIRRLTRERRGRRLWGVEHNSNRVEAPDIAGALDLRAALIQLPERKRACVVLRHYYGLTERETARILGIAVGTVKSQTSRGLEQLSTMLDESRTRAAGNPGTGRHARTEGVTG